MAGLRHHLRARAGIEPVRVSGASRVDRVRTPPWAARVFHRGDLRRLAYLLRRCLSSRWRGTSRSGARARADHGVRLHQDLCASIRPGPEKSGRARPRARHPGDVARALSRGRLWRRRHGALQRHEPARLLDEDLADAPKLPGHHRASRAIGHDDDADHRHLRLPDRGGTRAWFHRGRPLRNAFPEKRSSKGRKLPSSATARTSPSARSDSRDSGKSSKTFRMRAAASSRGRILPSCRTRRAFTPSFTISSMPG